MNFVPEGQGFAARRYGSSGHEIVGPDGVVAWTMDGYWAAVIVALLNGADDSEASCRGMPPCQGNSGRKADLPENRYQ